MLCHFDIIFVRGISEHLLSSPPFLGKYAITLTSVAFLLEDLVGYFVAGHDRRLASGHQVFTRLVPANLVPLDPFLHVSLGVCPRGLGRIVGPS